MIDSSRIDEFFSQLSRSSGPIIVDTTTGVRREIGADGLTDLLDRVAARLENLGVNPGERVVAVFDNCMESALTLLAALRHGVTLCLQPPGTNRDVLLRLQEEIGANASIDATRSSKPVAPQVLMEELPRDRRSMPHSFPLTTPLTITFTSGSTGTPKAVVHSSSSYLSCADVFNQQSGIIASDRFLNVMPMFYMAGIFNGLLAPLAAGASVVIEEAFSTSTAIRFWPIVQDEGISAVWLSPTMLSLVLRLDRSSNAINHALRRLFVGTGALKQKDAEDFAARYGTPVVQSYGLSELLYVSVDDVESPNYGSVGFPLNGVQLITSEADPLSILTPFAFLGYLVNGVVQQHQGPFVTSDFVEANENGTYAVVGRSDDVIIRGGVNIDPLHLEDALRALILGCPFCIVGLADGVLGQRVVLVLDTVDIDASLFREARRLVDSLPGRARLDQVFSLQHLPIGPTGKIQRAKVRAILEARGQ